MRREQHDDHCILVLPDGTPWRIAKVAFPVVALTCLDGCGKSCRFRFGDGFDFTSYCDDGALHLLGRALRAERGLPVSTGSEAWN